MLEGYFIIGLIISACLGLIPANIAKNKGYSFGLWWFYGWTLFIVAVIHVKVIPDKNQANFHKNAPNYDKTTSERYAVGELKKYKELFERGVISEEEFQMKKEQLLKFSRMGEKTTKIYSTVGAVLFTLLGCYNIYHYIEYIPYFGDLDFKDIFYIVFECAVLIGFGVTLFLRNKKGILIVSAVKAALILYMLFRIFDVYYVFYFAGYAGLVYISALAIRRNNIVRKAWFIPGDVLCAVYLLGCGAYGFFHLIYLVESAGILFIALWFREETVSPLPKRR